MGDGCQQLLFLVIAALQTGALSSWHQYTVWRHVYPLPDTERLKSLIAVDRLALIVIFLLLWLAGCIPLLLQGSGAAPAVAAAAAAAVVLLLRPRRLRKVVLAAEED